MGSNAQRVRNARSRIGATLVCVSGRPLPLGVVVVASAACGNVSADESRSCVDDRGPAALVAIDGATGDVLWTQLVGDVYDIDASGDVVAMVSSNGTAVGLDARSGRGLWCGRLFDEGAEILWPLDMASAAGVFATFDGDGDVVGLDHRTGAIRWRTPGLVDASSIVSAGGRFVVESAYAGAAAHDGSPAIDPYTGERVAVVGPEDPRLVQGSIEVRVSSRSQIGVVEPPLVTESATTPTAPPVPRGDDRQAIEVSVVNAGAVLWKRVVPGYTAWLGPGIVLVSDQNGGTGRIGHHGPPPPDRFRLAAYDVGSGDRRWELEGAWSMTPASTDRTLITTYATQVAEVSAEDGEVVWLADVGSPGVSDRFSEPGGYSSVVAAGPTGDTLVGLVIAQEPYRD
jgi:outer membrane protein assembly factor BamB